MTAPDPGEEIRTARLERGMSRAELAAAVGVGFKTIQRLEAGQTDNSTKLPMVQKFLGIGPYADEPDTRLSDVARLDLSQLSNQELISLQFALTAVISNRLVGEPKRAPADFDPAPGFHATAYVEGPVPWMADEERRQQPPA